MAAGTALNVSLFSALSDKREMSRNYWQKYTKYTKYNNTRDTFFHHNLMYCCYQQKLSEVERKNLFSSAMISVFGK